MEFRPTADKMGEGIGSERPAACDERWADDASGDSVLATFGGPARAIRCAGAISAHLRSLGLDVRIGLHAGECEFIAGKVGGVAVHIGARVAAHAHPAEVLVTSTVKDLVVGAGFRFVERGVAALKGVPEEWRLFAVDLDEA